MRRIFKRRSKATPKGPLGLPLAGRRPLTVEEQRIVRLMARSLAWQSASWWAFALLLWPVFIAIGMHSPSHHAHHTSGNGWGLALVLDLLLLCLLAASLGKDQFQQSRSLRQDLRAGSVELFAGPLDWDAANYRVLARLKGTGNVPLEPGEPWCAGVLSISRRVLHVADVPVKPWITAPATMPADVS
ncbi:MAG: hypothetical protein JWQ02_2727 [Capsulimonas sp.]|nr:hypothetical protein [Capsulimonas sp.]